MNTEVEKLLSSIFQFNGQVQVSNGQLLVGPPLIAHKFGDQIRRLKPEILLALGCCPICAKELIVETGMLNGRMARHVHCSEPGHFDKWEF